MRDDDALQNNAHVSRRKLQELHSELFAWALSRSGYDHAVAEDLLQQTYVEILSGDARFANQSTLRTFMYGVVQNLARSRFRQLATRLRIVRAHAAEVQPDVWLDADGQDDHRKIWQAVEALPDRQRDITELVFCREMTIEEASTVMGVSVGTGRVHYQRAKKALASKLAILKTDGV